MTDDREVYSSFGSMGYWHNVPDAPTGTVTEKAERLLEIWRDGTAGGHWRGPMKPVQLRAMALELTVAAGRQREPIPEALVKLLAELLQLPDGFLRDPVALFVHGRVGKGQTTPPGAFSLAMWVDSSEIQKTGKQPSARKLSKLMKEQGTPVDEKTLRTWRKDEVYLDWLALIENEGK